MLISISFVISYCLFADCLKARYVLCLMVFVGFMNIYLLRLNLNIAIVGMVNRTASAVLQKSSSTSNIEISPCLNISEPVSENSDEEISVDLEVTESYLVKYSFIDKIIYLIINIREK